jgi:riboflavin kinase / FMN adenylyltransferase
MRVVRHLTAAERPFRAPVIALGNFDGCHRGHAAIVSRARVRAADVGGEAVVYTFWPHPVAVLHPQRAPAMILTLAERLGRLRDLGVAGVVLRRFTRTFASLEPERFIEDVLVGALGARVVVVGYNVNFGKERRGTPELLVEMGARLGFDVEVVPAVAEGDDTVSSSAIRRLLEAGDVAGAARLLGRAHAVKGKVWRGARRGASLGFPTANLFPRGGMLPPDGVYAVRVGLEGERVVRPAVANLGCNPTFGLLRRRLEVHVFDYDGDLYDRTLRVAFVERLRGEERFPSVDALVAQIRSDAERARHVLATANEPE